MLHGLLLCELILQINRSLHHLILPRLRLLPCHAIIYQKCRLAVTQWLLVISVIITALILYLQDLLPVHIGILEVVAGQDRVKFFAELDVGLTGLMRLILLLGVIVLLEDAGSWVELSLLLLLLLRRGCTWYNWRGEGLDQPWYLDRCTDALIIIIWSITLLRLIPWLLLQYRHYFILIVHVVVFNFQVVLLLLLLLSVW